MVDKINKTDETMVLDNEVTLRYNSAMNEKHLRCLGKGELLCPLY